MNDIDIPRPPPHGKKKKKIYLRLREDTSEGFTCIRPEKGCFIRQTENICPQSPCPKNLFKFGTHERIIDYHLYNRDWSGAYYYFKDLLPQFSIDCDVNQMTKLRAKSEKEIDLEQIPPGCRVFKIADILKKRLRIIQDLEQLDAMATDEKPLSQTNQRKLSREQINFRKQLYSCLSLLQHLAIDKREKRTEKLERRKYNIALTKTQMGDLQPEALDVPLNKDSEDAIRGKDEQEEKKREKRKSRYAGI